MMKITTHFSYKPPVESENVDHVVVEYEDITFEFRKTSSGLLSLQAVWPINGMLAITPGGSNLVHIDVITSFRPRPEIKPRRKS